MAWHLLLPLASSLLYAVAALLLKRAAVLGAGVVRTTAVINGLTAVAFLALLPLGGTVRVAELWQPAIVGLLFVAGQTATFVALTVGDVSVATPVMGIKTVLVGGLATVVLADRPPWQLWAAAGLSAAAIALLNASGGGRSRVLVTSLWALAAAGCYSCFDVLVQKWVPAWGAGRFLPIAAAVAATPALAAWPFLGEPRETGRAAWPWLLGGAAVMAVQAVILTAALGIFGDATAVNVVYSARGLWAVLAVWAVGGLFKNDERLLGRRVLRARLCGAAVMTAAIVVAMTR